MANAPTSLQGISTLRPSNIRGPVAQQFAPASIGAPLEKIRCELTACCERLKSDMPQRGAVFIDETMHLVDQLSCRIAIIGQVKAGKSSFINAFIRRPSLLPTHVNPWTTAVTCLHFGRNNPPKDVAARFTFFDADEWKRLAQGGGHVRELTQRFVPGFEAEHLKQHLDAMRRQSESRLGWTLDDLLGRQHDFAELEPGTLSQYVCSGEHQILGGTSARAGIYSDIVKQADLYFPGKDFGFPTVLIDTPGTNDPFLVRDEITRRALDAADIYVVVMTARQALSSADISLLRILRGLNKERIVVFINRVDELGDVVRDTAEVVEHVRAGLRREFPNVEIPIIPGSALWAKTAVGGSDAEITQLLSGKAKAYALKWCSNLLLVESVSDATAPEVRHKRGLALMQCSGLPAFCEALCGIATQSHAGHVLRQVSNSLFELSQVSQSTAQREIEMLEGEARAETVNYQHGRDELVTIGDEVGENERLAVTMQSLLIDLQTRTHQIVGDHSEFVAEMLRDAVHGYSEMECVNLSEYLGALGTRRMWMCDTAKLRRSLETTFIKQFRQGQKKIRELESNILPKLNQLLATYQIDTPQLMASTPAAPASDLPSLMALGQTVALDLAEPWWRRWWSQGRSAEELQRELDRLICQEFYPIVDELVQSARARLAMQQSAVLQSATTLFLSLIEILQEQSRARQARIRQLTAERNTVEKGDVARERSARIDDLQRQKTTARQVAVRLQELNAS